MNAFFKQNSTVLFQGDSITDCGRNYSVLSSLADGYAGKIAKIYSALFPSYNVSFVNKGVSGNRAVNLLERYNADFKAINPDFVSILIGVNDTWRRYDSNDITTTEQYEVSYAQLLSRIKADLPNAKIMIIEPFLMHTPQDRYTWREDLNPKIDACRRLANKYADYYLPMDGIFASLQTKGFNPALLAADGVHPTDYGHSIIAAEYLRLLGIL